MLSLELPTYLREDFTMSEDGPNKGYSLGTVKISRSFIDSSTGHWSVVSFTGSQEFNPRQLCKMIFKSSNKFTESTEQTLARMMAGASWAVQRQ